jgi:hypothetical protein
LFRNPEEGQGSQRAVVPVMMMMMMMMMNLIDTWETTNYIQGAQFWIYRFPRAQFVTLRMKRHIQFCQQI